MSIPEMNLPTPSRIRILDLISGIEAGTIVLPDFQRHYIWDVRECLALFDSLNNKYPIGDMLFWKTTENLNSWKSIAGSKVERLDKNKEKTYVLDGQQRCATLFSAFKKGKITTYGRRNAKAKHYLIFYYIPKKVFVAQNEKKKFFSKDLTREQLSSIDTSDLLPLSVILHEETQTINDTFDRKNVRIALQLRDNFTRHEITLTEIKNCDLRTAAEIFERVNTTGQKLDVFEIMVAKTFSEKFNLRSKIDKDLPKILEEFGGNYKLVLQCMSAQIAKGTSNNEILDSADKLPRVWKKLTKNIRLAVDFVKQNVGISKSNLLPYPIMLAPLSLAFSSTPRSSFTPEQRKNLLAWFWSTGINSCYLEGQNSKVRADCAMIVAFIKGKTKKLKVIPEVSLSKSQLIETKYSTTDSKAKTVLCFYAAQNPRDFEGNRVDVNGDNFSRYNSKELHHFFPSSCLSKEPSLNKLKDSIVNICLIPRNSNARYNKKLPGVYLSEAEKINKKLKRDLETHFILDSDPIGLKEKEDFKKFLDARANRIIRQLKKNLKV